MLINPPHPAIFVPNLETFKSPFSSVSAIQETLDQAHHRHRNQTSDPE